MYLSRRMIRAALALAAISALWAVSASSAMAAAHWSDTTHGMKVSGTLTFKTAGQTTKTCTASSSQESSMSSESGWVWTSGKSGAYVTFSCTGGGILNAFTLLTAKSTTSVQWVNTHENETAPWSGISKTYLQGESPLGEFVNGSGGTASTLTFGEKSVLGAYEGNLVYVSGTLTVTTSTGGLLTILP